MHQIMIESLGPIQDFKMEIKDNNLFIGEQASGKSTVCKAIYFFREIKNHVIDCLQEASFTGDQEKDIVKSIQRLDKDLFIKLFGYSWDLPDSLKMKYIYRELIEIEVCLSEKTKRYIGITYSSNLIKEVRNLFGQAKKFYNGLESLNESYSFDRTERIRWHQEMREKINSIFDDYKETYYIPAGRSMLTLMTNQKTKLDYENMDLLNIRFMQFIESIRMRFDSGIRDVIEYYDNRKENSSNYKKVARDIVRILKGNYYYQDGKEYFLINEGVQKEENRQRIPINFTSSGQQEILWLLNQLYILLLKNEQSFVIIEEPEAHLYPTLQKEIVEYIVQFVNLSGGSAVITTHSPYTLTTMNILYRAGKIRQVREERGDDLEALYKIIPGEKMIQPDNINILKLSRGLGKSEVESLLDEEAAEIRSELIDEVSDKINQLYTELFYLEAEHE